MDIFKRAQNLLDDSDNSIFDDDKSEAAGSTDSLEAAMQAMYSAPKPKHRTAPDSVQARQLDPAQHQAIENGSSSVKSLHGALQPNEAGASVSSVPSTPRQATPIDFEFHDEFPDNADQHKPLRVSPPKTQPSDATVALRETDRHQHRADRGPSPVQHLYNHRHSPQGIRNVKPPPETPSQSVSEVETGVITYLDQSVASVAPQQHSSHLCSPWTAARLQHEDQLSQSQLHHPSPVVTYMEDTSLPELLPGTSQIWAARKPPRPRKPEHPRMGHIRMIYESARVFHPSPMPPPPFPVTYPSEERRSPVRRTQTPLQRVPPPMHRASSRPAGRSAPGSRSTKRPRSCQIMTKNGQSGFHKAWTIIPNKVRHAEQDRAFSNAKLRMYAQRPGRRLCVPSSPVSPTSAVTKAELEAAEHKQNKQIVDMWHASVQVCRQEHQRQRQAARLLLRAARMTQHVHAATNAM